MSDLRFSRVFKFLPETCGLFVAKGAGPLVRLQGSYRLENLLQKTFSKNTKMPRPS